jgi:hypothetical protein
MLGAFTKYENPSGAGVYVELGVALDLFFGRFELLPIVEAYKTLDRDHDSPIGAEEGPLSGLISKWLWEISAGVTEGGARLRSRTRAHCWGIQDL